MSSTSTPFIDVSRREVEYIRQATNPIKDMLNGDNAFYKHPNYLKNTQRDLLEKKALPTIYTWNTENKIIRIAKQIFSIIFFPIKIYNYLHSSAGKGIFLPASNPTSMKYSKNHANNSRSRISLEGSWKYKRITIEVDGYQIDAMIAGKESTLNNGRWVLSSNGNGEFYEDKLSCNNFKQILSEINSNAIVFNYPGVGASSGVPNKQAMAKAYRAILTFLEDQENGIGAKEIIGYGHSIGGGVQGEALKTHDLKKDIKYVFVKSRTFSNMSIIASVKTKSKFLGFLVKLLGWNLDSVESSKKLQSPEIIMQTAAVKGYVEMSDSDKIIGDGIIPADASLAKALLDDKNCTKKNKLFIGMKEMHNSPLIDPSFLAKKIEAFLKS